MAVGVLVGGALQFLIQVPSMRRVGFRYQPLLSFRDERVRQVMRLIGPAILGVAALQVNVLVNSIFASEGVGWLTWINRAFRLMHLPIGVFGVAISTVALPNLAKLVAEGDMEAYRRSFSYALRLMFLLTVPASIGLMVLAEPICRLIFEGDRRTLWTHNRRRVPYSIMPLGYVVFGGQDRDGWVLHLQRHTHTGYGQSVHRWTQYPAELPLYLSVRF